MPEIDLGKVTGERGPQGTRGSLWYTGTGVTGTAAEGTVMPSSGVDDAKVDDIYLNVSTDDIYICVLEGAADTAKWAYKGSIKGNIGPQGPAGPTGAVDENTPMTFEQAAARKNINSGEAIKTIFGKVKKWFADLGAAAFCNVVNNGTTTAENTVLDGRMGKTLTDEDNNLQTQIDGLNENLTYKHIAGTSFENAVSNAYLDRPTTIWGQNLTGIDGITNGDNDVLIVVYRYPAQQYQSLKALVFDFRSTKVKAISQINGSWNGWYDIVG